MSALGEITGRAASRGGAPAVWAVRAGEASRPDAHAATVRLEASAGAGRDATITISGIAWQ